MIKNKTPWDSLSLAEQAEMMKVAVKNGIYNLNDIRDKYNEFAEGRSKEEEEEVNTNNFSSGGKIHIKPSHRGRLTELKKRTGKTEAELYRTGGPAVRKMITFARNARKWKHSDGGPLINLFYPGGTITYGAPHYFYDEDGQLVKDENGNPVINYNGNLSEIVITPQQRTISSEDKEVLHRVAKPLLEKRAEDYFTESNDATAVDYGRQQNTHLEDRAIAGAKANADWEKEHPALRDWGYVTAAAPFLVASAPLGVAGWAGISALGDAAAATSAGQAIAAGFAPAYSAITNAAVAGAPLLTWADAGLRTTMLTSGLEDLLNGKFTPETAFELTPAVPAITRTPGIIRNLQPQEIRNHLYVSKAPVGYEGMGDAIERWTRGILSGKKADIEHPWWLGNSDAHTAKQVLIKEYAPIPGGIQGAEREQFLERWSDHALKARADAWRMHNLIPQKYNTFTPNTRHPGAWTDEEGIKMLKWMPAQVEGQEQFDFVSSVGGNIGVPTITRLGNGIPDTGTQLKRFGVTTTSDWFDLHPMSRPKDRLIRKYIRPIWKQYVRNPIYGVTGHNIGVPKFNMLKPLDTKLAKLEVGDLTGGKPFLVQYDIPWTANTKFTDTGGVSTEIVPGFQSENLLPQSVFDWRNNVTRDIEQPNLEFKLNDIDLLNLRLTTKRKRK